MYEIKHSTSLARCSYGSIAPTYDGISAWPFGPMTRNSFDGLHWRRWAVWMWHATWGDASTGPDHGRPAWFRQIFGRIFNADGKYFEW